MAKTRFTQNTFTSGVLSPLIKGRTDLQQYYAGLESASDWVLLPQGGMRRRPGTKHVDAALPILTRNTTVATTPNGGAGANISDEDDSTSTVTTTNVSTLDPYVVAKLDLGSAKYIEVADVRGIFLTSSTNVEFRVQYSTDDITYITAATVPSINTVAQDFRLAVTQTARYWQLARIGSTDLGTDKVTLTDFNLWEKSATLSNVNIKDFSVEAGRHYLMAITAGNCTIYKKGTNVRVADIKLPYLTSEVLSVRDIQSESVMLLFHKEHQTQRIINTGTDGGWAADDAPYTNVPQFDYNDSSSPTPTSDVQVLTFGGSTGWVAGDTFRIDVEGVISKTITFAGDSTAAEQVATSANIQKNLQDMPTFAASGVSVSRTGALAYTITSADGSAKAFKLFSGYPLTGAAAAKLITFTHSTTGVARTEDIWSVTRGYPKTACIWQGRLVIGATKSKPQSLFLSKSGSLFDFDIDEGDADDGIFVTISSRKLNNIVDVYPGKDLQIFTDGAEFTVSVSPVTPENITVTPQTTHGSLDLEAKSIDGGTIFVDRNGRSLKEYIFNFNEDKYSARDLSVMTPELISTPLDIAILGGTSSEDANWVFIVNADGSAAILNTLRSQDINGFTKWTTTGALSNVSVVDDALFMVNKRTVGGVESYFIEEWDFDMYLDNALTVTNSAPLTSVPGFDHLNGETVTVLAVDPTDPLKVIVIGDRLVTAGAITLTAAESVYTKIQAGIKFVPSFKPMPANTNAGSGQNAMRQKHIISMNVRVHNSYGLAIDGESIPVRAFNLAASSPLNSFPNTVSGVAEDILGIMGWGVDDMPVFTLPDPTPATVLGIEYEISSS